MLIIGCVERKKFEPIAQNTEPKDSFVLSCKDADSIRTYVSSLRNVGDERKLIVALKDGGRYFRDKCNFKEGLDMFSEGLRISRSLNDTLSEIRFLNFMGSSYRRMGLLDESCDCFYRSLECNLAYSKRDIYGAKQNNAASHYGLACIFMELGNYSLADSALRCALRKECELNNTLGLAINYSVLGRLMELQGRKDSAWHFFRRALYYNEKVSSTVGVSLCHVSFGKLYETEGRYDLAISEFRYAYARLDSLGDQWNKLDVLLALAEVYEKNGEYYQCLDYLKRSCELAVSIRSLVHLGRIYNIYYKVYKHEGDSKMALHYYEKAQQCVDSVVDYTNISRIQNARVEHEHYRMRKALNEAQNQFNKEKRSQRSVLMIIGIVLFLSVVALLVLSHFLRIRRRSQSLLNEVQQTRSRFFMNTTHEFRTPLTVIMGVAQQIRSGEIIGGERLRTCAGMIEEQGRCLLNLVNQLLDISKVKSEVGVADWRHGDVVGYMRMLMDSLTEYASQKQIELRYAPYENEVYMDFVPDYLLKIVRNLISNAVNYTPSGGKVTLTSRCEGTNWKLIVSDTGEGISKECLPHIFEPFYQAQTESRHIGAGVGLSLVYQMIKSVNGSIKVESEVNKGTTFTILLPTKYGSETWKDVEVENVQLETETPVVKPADLTDTLSVGDRVARIMIVEDNHDVAYYIGSQLEKNYALIYARNGREGIERAEEVIPNLIITDLMMPEMDGVEFCKRIRSSELTSHIPIIIITAKAMEEDMLECLKAGADVYLLKPFSPDELKVRVWQLLEQRRLLRENYIRVMPETKPMVKVNDEDRTFLDRVIGIVYKMMKKGDVNVEAISQQMFMSPSKFRSKIIALTNETPVSYIMRVRMSYARRLFDEQADIRVSEVGEKCGFNDNAHFSRAFKLYYKVTPTEYKKGVRIVKSSDTL